MVHDIKESKKSKICNVGQQAVDPGDRKANSTESYLLKNSLWLREARPFILLMPSTDWTRPTHIMKNNLLYPGFTDFNFDFIQKYSYRNTHKKV